MINLDYVVLFLLLVRLQMTITLANPDAEVVFAAFHLFLDLLVFNSMVKAAAILREIFGFVND